MSEHRNTVYLYGDIRDIFDGCLEPAQLLTDGYYVDRKMRFGLGVCSFSDDVADIADSCFVDGRFFVKHTAEGLDRAGQAASEYGLKQRILQNAAGGDSEIEYVAPYALGITDLEHYDLRYWFSSDQVLAHEGVQPTMQDMLISFTEGAHTQDSSQHPGTDSETERLVGFIGICEFDSWWGTSLLHAPIEGRNILKDIDYFARPGRDYGPRMGVVVGFAQRVLVDDPNWEEHELLERMFFENPHDRAKGGSRPSERSEDVFRIASHTHGVLLSEGDNIFTMEGGGRFVDETRGLNEAFVHRLRDDEAFRADFAARTFARDFTDSSHVIPDSVLRRYMFLQFDVENVVVRGPIADVDVSLPALQAS